MPHVDFIGSDGKPWPSATQLTNLLPQEWLWSWYKQSVKKSGWRGWQRCKAQSNRGMRIGTEVHGLIENFIAKGSMTVKPVISGKYESEAFADALFDKVNPMVKHWIAVEPHVKSEELRVHGTADAIVHVKIDEQFSETAILDWKTSASKSLTHPIQLAIYAYCWNEEHPEELVNRGIIARIDKTSKYRKAKIDDYPNLAQYYPVVRALRTIWEYNNEY